MKTRVETPREIRPRVERGCDDPLITRAPAKIARDRLAHFAFGGVGVVAQEFKQGGQHAGRAEAALQAVIVLEGLLQRVQLLVVGRDALHRQNLPPVGLDREHEATSRGAAVEQDSAGAANAVLASDMGAGEQELVANEVGQQHPGLDLARVGLAVDRDSDLAQVSH